MNAKRLLMASCLVLSLYLPGQSAAQGPVGGLVVFGTSLSDPGNAFAVLGEANTPPDWSGEKMFLVPNRPYARGGRHFSNGATWIEQMARPLGLAASAKGAFTPGGGTNFAFGGARARFDSDSPSPSLLHQIGAFLQATGNGAPGAALYVIEMGGNDMRDGLEMLQPDKDPSGATTFGILEAALDAIVRGIKVLHGAGATKFMVWNMPNIGATPALNRDPAAVGAAIVFTAYFNGRLGEELLKLSEEYEIDIKMVDVNGKLEAIVTAPAEFGLTNTTQACISLEAPYSCAQPNDYLFWDGIHPSAAGHAILAHEAARVLAP